jgi:hypothetical protein
MTHEESRQLRAQAGQGLGAIALGRGLTGLAGDFAIGKRHQAKAMQFIDHVFQYGVLLVDLGIAGLLRRHSPVFLWFKLLNYKDRGRQQYHLIG